MFSIPFIKTTFIMKYPLKKITLPTIYMSACGATQLAAEGYFPHQTIELVESEIKGTDSKPNKTNRKKRAFLNAKTCHVLLVGVNLEVMEILKVV